MAYPNDPKFTEAEAWLHARNVLFRRTSPYQLKIGRRVSYYPSKGRIFIDGEGKSRDQTGLAALEAVLREEGLLRGPARHPVPLIIPALPDLDE